MPAELIPTPERWSLLGSAIAGRPLQVESGEPGELAWTDAKAIFVDPRVGPRDQLDALVVQASLLATGSLAPDVMRKLVRRPALAKRYLAIEGHRALTAIHSLLPPSVRALIDPDLAGRGDSPAASLLAASSREAIAEPPTTFGALHPRRLLASMERTVGSTTKDSHASRDQRRNVLAELAGDHDDDGVVSDLLSNPVGGGGTLGRLFQRMLAVLRRHDAGDAPGADAPTHPARAGALQASFSIRTAGSFEAGVIRAGGTKYPEWDLHQQRYRHDWCTVQEIEVRPADGTSGWRPSRSDLRRPLARLGLGLDRHRRQPQGDDIDLDAAIEARVEVLAGSAPDETFYVDSLRRRRDLAVLVLLDVSGSAAEPGAAGQTVHEQQLDAAAALTIALHEIGDRVALYAYQSRGRAAVQLLPVKRFGEHPDTLMFRRLRSLVPGAYSRLGAAIRHGAAVLERRGGTPRRLLVVLSDGLAYDHGYEPAYGAADARRALAEARRRGTGCLCLSIGASTDAETLRRVFGSAAHATLPRTEQLSRVVGPLFRSALRSAERRNRWRATA